MVTKGVATRSTKKAVAKTADQLRKAAGIARKYRKNKKNGIVSRSKVVGEPTTPTVLYNFKDVQDLIQSWSTALTKITQMNDRQQQQKKLRDFIKKQINPSIQWKRIHKIDMFTLCPSDEIEVVNELSILGILWFVMKELVVAKSSDGIIQYGLFTNRTFKKGDFLGVYLGELSRISSFGPDVPLPTHQFKILDAKKGKKDVYPLYLGVHFINDPNLDDKLKKVNQCNAVIGSDYKAVASKYMKKNIEILIDYNV